LKLTNKTPKELFRLYGEILIELRDRSIIRSTNNPIADYGELLFEKALDLTRTSKSTKGHDAVSANGVKYEVKARRITAQNGSRQLSALRALDKAHFDFLAGILFREDFSVWKGCLVPRTVVDKHSTYREHTNAWIFHLEDGVWSYPGVVDVTDKLLVAEKSISGN
jgi:hypothetical protein